MAATSAIPTAAPVVNQTAERARQPLPAHLPRETRKVLPKQEACPDCGGELKPLGEDVSETLEYVPEHFQSDPAGSAESWLVRAVTKSCMRKQRVVRSRGGWRVLDFWPTCWFRNTVTTCRCIGSRRSMREVSRAGSLDHGGVGRRMQPVTGALGGGLATSRDERREVAPRTILQCRCWRRGMGKTKTGRLWTYVRDDRPWGDQTPPAVWFTPTRRIARANIR